jgi:hypothetical protein
MPETKSPATSRRESQRPSEAQASTRRTNRRNTATPMTVAVVRRPTRVGGSNGDRVPTEYIDSWGRKFVVLVIPDTNEDPAHAPIKGPIPLDSLELPQPLMVRLHNELYIRGLITRADVMSRPQDVQGALLAALKVDVTTIQALYRDLGRE